VVRLLVPPGGGSRADPWAAGRASPPAACVTTNGLQHASGDETASGAARRPDAAPRARALHAPTGNGGPPDHQYTPILQYTTILAPAWSVPAFLDADLGCQLVDFPEA
jgi:hypothetical protein